MIGKKPPIAELGKFEKNIGAGGTYRMRLKVAKEPLSEPAPEPKQPAEARGKKAARKKPAPKSGYWSLLW